MIRQTAMVMAVLFLASTTWGIQVVGDPDVQINGKLGIGTASPQSPMHILRNDALTNTQSFRVEQAGSGDTQMTFVISGVYTYAMGIDNSDADKFKINRGSAPGALNDFVLTTTGNMGLGVASPEKVLHIRGNTQFNHDMLIENVGTGTSGMFLKANGGAANFKLFVVDTRIGIWDINQAAERLSIIANGNVGIGTTTPATKLDVNGEATVKVLNITGGSDLSESFEATHPSGEEVQPGMILSIDSVNPGELVVSTQAYDRKVAGVVSGAGGLDTGLVMGQPGTLAHGKYPVALTGRVYCLADATESAIEPGDLLTTSNTPGHAMKVLDNGAASGAVIGKAMSSLEGGTGLVLVLVNLQ